MPGQLRKEAHHCYMPATCPLCPLPCAALFGVPGTGNADKLKGWFADVKGKLPRAAQGFKMPEVGRGSKGLLEIRRERPAHSLGLES